MTKISRGGLTDRFMIDGRDTEGRFALVQHLFAPRALAAPMHRHRLEDEYTYVVNGRIGAALGGEEFVGGPGDLIFKPRAALLISPALLSGPLPFYPLLTIGDVTDLVTPVVLLPLYWLLLRASGGAITTRSAVLFLGLAAIWASGHGMHMGANAIGHLLAEQDGDAYRLTHFLDEHLSHYLWHGAMIGFVALVLAGPLAGGAASARDRRGPLLAWPLALGAVVYGATFFIVVIEGVTWPIGVPFTALVVLAGARWWLNGELAKQPLRSCFWLAHALAMLLFIGWGPYWGGLPEFSAVGIID